MAEYYDVLYRTGRYGNWSLSERLLHEDRAYKSQGAIANLIDMGYEVKIEKVYA